MAKIEAIGLVSFGFDPFFVLVEPFLSGAAAFDPAVEDSAFGSDLTSFAEDFEGGENMDAIGADVLAFFGGGEESY